MRLALSTLADRLPPQFGARLRDASQNQELYERPLLYVAGMSFEGGVLYIARGNALPDEAPTCSCAIICVGSATPWPRSRRSLPVLHVPHESNLALVLNAVLDIYNECERWDIQLRDELEKSLDYDIRNVLTIGTGFLKRSLSVVDQNLRSVFRTSIELDDSGAARVAMNDAVSPLTMETNEQIKEVCALERKLREPYFSALEAMGKSYCNNLYPLGHFAGCVSITASKVPFRDGEFPLIDHFFRLFQKAYLKYLQSYGNSEETGLKALQNVLNHVPLSHHEAELLSLGRDEQWCCFQLRERRDGRSFPKDYMYATLSGIFPRTVYAVIFGQSVVGLIRVLRTTTLMVDPKLNDIGGEVRRMGYYGGVSNTFSDLSKLDRYLRQAEFAVERGNDATQPLYFFHDYALSYLMESCMAEMPADEIIGQGLKNLIAYDAAKGSEHVRTLELYLQNETNVSQTAQALFIHRSSLLKRLDKIKSVLDDDLENSNHRLYYRLCLALIRHAKKHV